jgi:hypothetical protein
VPNPLRPRSARHRRFDARQVAFMGGAVALVAVLAAAALTPAILVTYGIAFNVETTFARMWPVVLLTLSFATACIVLLLGLRIGGAHERAPAVAPPGGDDLADVEIYVYAKDTPQPVAAPVHTAANDPALDPPGDTLHARPLA